MKSIKRFFPFTAMAFLFFLSGCAKDQISPESEVSPTQLITSSSKYDVREPDPDPEEDCKCFMSILNVDNGTGDPAFESWVLRDFTSMYPPYSFEYYGADDSYFNSGVLLPLPTQPTLLESPNANGCNNILLYYEEEAPGDFLDFTIETLVECYIENPDGTLTLATTTSHNFVLSEGTSFGSNGASFWRKFSCLVLTEGDDCDK